MNDDGQKFYSVDELPPPKGVRVYVLWPYARGIRGPFEAARMTRAMFEAKRPLAEILRAWMRRTRRQLQSDDSVWVIEHNDRLILLPDATLPLDDPSRPWVGWHALEGEAPSFWAPLKPERWEAPLPPVAYVWRNPDSVTVHYAYEKQTYKAADLAAEMEADREAARRETDVSRENRQGARSSRVAEQWWRDATRINFDQRPKDLKLRDCEGRLMRAIALAAAGDMGLAHDDLTSDALTKIGEAAAEVSDKYPTSDLAVRLSPCPKDGGNRWLEAMRWFASLGNRPRQRNASDTRTTWALSQKQKILIWRALPIPLSFDEIGQHITSKYRTKESVSGTTAKTFFDEAIDWAWRVGSGLETTWADVEIENLRARNRAWRRNNQGALL